MPQFRENSAAPYELLLGLMTYPCCRRPTLLYDADLVPVGEEQRRTFELSGDLSAVHPALRQTFVVPRTSATGRD